MATRDDHDVSVADPSRPSTMTVDPLSVPSTTSPPDEPTPEEAADDLAMTSRYTDAEWESFISAALPHIKPSPKARHRVPRGEELAKTIDHTLLKLDATERQIDVLCEEARRDQFMVRSPLFHHASHDVRF